MHLFTYGSLILPEVWTAVTGKLHPSEPGTISGFLRRSIHGATFPGILPTQQKNDTVDGSIYHEVDTDSLIALDEFESDFYERQTVEARTSENHLIICQAYVVKPNHAALLSDSPWDLNTFKQDHLKTFPVQNLHFKTTT